MSSTTGAPWVSTHRGSLLTLGLLSLTACGGGGHRSDGSVPDASTDARVDASGDAAVDGAIDSGLDAAIDADVDAGPTGSSHDGLCTVELSYHATGSRPTVHAAGSWNAFSPTAGELVDDGSGHYTEALELAPGLYPYKLVVDGDGAEPWRLDPGNSYRAYAGGVENSGLRVPDCSKPTLVVDSSETSRPADGDGRFVAALHYERREAAILADVRAELRGPGGTRDLSATALVRAGDNFSLSLATLADGKYTVALTPLDIEGTEGPATLLPFWIEAEPFRWRDALIYLVMTDRFRDGDTSNDAAPVGALGGTEFEGGDLRGIRQAIDDGYMDSMGVNALWITPWTTQPAGAYGEASGAGSVTGYHGYWPIEPRAIDARFGDPAELTALVQAAHAHGIRILMDLVVNHVHQDHPYYSDHPDWFNDGCICGTAGCDWTARRLDCLFTDYLPDVNWENNEAATALLDDAMYWLEQYDLDGFRVDAVKHVVDGAVFNLRARVRERFETAGTHYFLMGETAMGWDSGAGPDSGGNVDNYGTISRYIGPDALDGQFDFVLYYASALSFANDTPGRGMSHVDFWTQASQSHYPAGAIMTPYLGSHDTSRWLSLASDPGRAGNKWSDLPSAPTTRDAYDRMYVALGWLFALPGAPLLYQGDEYGQVGGADPDNRRMTRFGTDLSALESSQLARVSALGRGRAALPGLRSTDYRPLLVTDDVWVVARGRGAELAIVALNRSASPATVSVPVPVDVAVDGRVFHDALPSGVTLTLARQSLDFTLPARSVRYLH